MKSGVNVLPVANPHEKMEGIQKVRPQEIQQMLNKAQQMPIKQEGNFVKVQFYEFKADEFEDMEDPNKNQKAAKKEKNKEAQKESAKEEPKENAKDKGKATTAAEKAPRKKKQATEREPKDAGKLAVKETTPKDQNEQPNQQNDPEENGEDGQPSEAKDQEVDQEVDKQEMQEMLNEYEQNEEKGGDLEQDQQEEPESDDRQGEELEPEQEDAQNEREEPEEGACDEAQEEMSLKEKKKYQSNYAEMMEELLNESQAESVPSKQTKQSQIKSAQPQGKQQKVAKKGKKDHEQVENEAFQGQESKQQEESYLKIIKQYQIKLKQLNEQLSKKQEPLTKIQEEEEAPQEGEEQDSSSIRRHLYPAMREINLYDEFRLPKLIEEQVQIRIQALEAEARIAEDMLKQKEAELEEERLKHEQELLRVKQEYEIQLEEWKFKLESMQQQVEKKGEQDDQDDLEEQITIRDCMDDEEKLNLKRDQLYSLISSGVGPSIDSSISSLLKEDFDLHLRYQKGIKKKGDAQIQRCMEIINSKIHDLITSGEAKDFMNQDVNSDISLSNMMGIGDALRLLQPATDSNIDSLISSQEQQQFRRMPQFNEQTLPDSSVSSLQLDRHDEQLLKLMDSDIENFEAQVDENNSLYQKLEQQLEQTYQIKPENKLEVYKKVAEQVKSEYDRKVKELKKGKQKNKVYKQVRKSKLPESKDISSSIGSLANHSIPQDMSSNVSSSIVGSAISLSERNKLLNENRSYQVDSNESGIDSLISRNEARELAKQGKEMDMNDSGIGSLISQREAQELQRQADLIDSGVSHQSYRSKVSQMMASLLLEQEEMAMNSSIGSLISKTEEAELRQMKVEVSNDILIGGSGDVSSSLKMSQISQASEKSSKGSIKSLLQMKQEERQKKFR